MASVALYIHWPFCLSKCPYCSFLSFSNYSAQLCEMYADALFRDLQKSLDNENVTDITSVFFGGGTPSLMSIDLVDKLLEFLNKKYQFSNSIEITMEANPATFDLKKMRQIRSVGVNRLSLGVQSFADKNLKFLGRIYDQYQAEDASYVVASVFDNFSFDFIYGYEGYDKSDAEFDLKKAVSYGCKHISCYQLAFEKGTCFYKKLENGEIKRITEDIEVDMYYFINLYLSDRGLHRYEISNYAMEGFESCHNLSYWNYKDYLGIGLGAHGRISKNNYKYEIVKSENFEDWGNGNFVKTYRALTNYEVLEEMLIMGLRLSNGIRLRKLSDLLSDSDIDEFLSKASFLQSHNLLEVTDEKISLTNEGSLRTDAVVEFLLQ